MTTTGQNVRRLRQEAGWDTPDDAHAGTIRLADKGLIPHPLNTNFWKNLERENRPPPTLTTILRARKALSAQLGRQVALDELVSETLDDHARGAAADQAADHAAEAARAARQRIRRSSPRSRGPRRKGEEQG